MKSIKASIIIIFAFVTAFAAERLKVTVKKQNFPDKNLTIVKSYRGDACIMLEMKEATKVTRAYRVNGKTIMSESDEDNDGFFENFMLFDPATGEFEWFSRSTNNIVLAVSTEKLEAVKSKKLDADKALSELLNLE